ncbi:MAG: hypothetical protein HYY45_16640 [Deltaproteobacteria bacterium]|nr:hypothetical protein [Deltaproteobacteria bacterium]
MDQVDAAFLIAGFVVGVLAILPTTALSACYYFLSVCELSDSLERGGTWKYTLRETILLALLASLIFQVWIHPYGWNWFDFIVSKSSAAGYLVVILLVGFLFLVELIFKSGFKNAATRRGAIIIKEVQNRNWNSLLESVLFVGSCMVLWQLASVPLAKYFLISSPANTLTAAYRILTDKLNIAGIEFIRWED